MSLRVDLIEEGEQRSGSAINVKSVIRVGSIIIPAIILFAIGKFVLDRALIVSELRVMESRWETAEPKQEHALKLAGRLSFNRATLVEMDAWGKARIGWNRQILAIMESAPPLIQLTTLVISQERGSDASSSPPVRNFTVQADGKTSGKDSIQYVQKFKENIETHDATQNVIETVEVANYAANPESNAGQFDRIFQLECKYYNPSEKAKE